jgi:Flp pilus assembly protein TadG
MALLAPVLLTLLVGLWEVGRVVMVMNILNNSAREAARVSASGAFFSSSNHNDPKATGQTLSLWAPSTNGDFEVQKKVLGYLQASGVSITGATITVTNSGSSSSSSKNWSYTWTASSGTSGSGSGSGSDPTAAADQLDRLSITVTLPYKNIAWSPTSFFFSNGSTLSAKADWLSLRDVPLVISSTIPTKPLQAADPLP